MHIRNKDRYSIIEAYNTVRECECQHTNNQNAVSNNSDDRIDMILNNLVNLNNKSAELVTTIQAAIDSGEGVEEWVSEKIAVATSMIGSINDYYAKFKQTTDPVISIPNLIGNMSATPATVASIAI